MRFRLAAALVAVIATAGLAMPTSATVAGPTSRDHGTGVADVVDASGIALVGPEAIQFRAENEAQALAFDAALNLALADRDDMGYPWIDLDSKTLELSAINERGEKAALLAEASLPAAGLTTRVTTAQASIARLDEIADDATRLIEAGVPHADLAWMTEPDQMNNRVIITVSTLDEELLTALASRFGTDLIAVRVREGGPAAAANRDSDSPLFWGGAKITIPSGGHCTTGFAWTAGSNKSMLTAAHCASTGGVLSYTNYPSVGSVASGSEENWSNTNGTQYYTGQSVYRGAVALIRYYSYGSGPYIYSGAPGTSTSSGVYAMASRWSQVGDAACANGVTTGEWCGMVVATGVNRWYVVNGWDVWARHVVEADAGGNTCPTYGDSGAPVYRKRSDGKVYAVGVLSGSVPLVLACAAYFTDIWDAYYGLPGTVQVGG